MEDMVKYHDEKLKELPRDIAFKASSFLKFSIPPTVIEQIKIAHEKDPAKWWAGYHHGWGTNIRNVLRDNVCADDQLPTNNWDDYYIPLVEVACGIRTMEAFPNDE